MEKPDLDNAGGPQNRWPIHGPVNAVPGRGLDDTPVANPTIFDKLLPGFPRLARVEEEKMNHTIHFMRESLATNLRPTLDLRRTIDRDCHMAMRWIHIYF